MMKRWKDGEALTEALLNAEIRDRARELFHRPRVTKVFEIGPSPVQQVNTTALSVNRDQFRVELETNGGNLLVLLTGSWLVEDTTAGRVDIFIDDTIYMSSMRASPLSWGWGVGAGGVDAVMALPVIGYIKGLLAGRHTFALHSWSPGGYVQIGTPDSALVMTVMEVG